jgi:serine/threonine protein kinase
VNQQLSKAGPYDIVEVLHRGPRATTYLAVRDASEVEVVLKMAVDPSLEEAASSTMAPLVHRHIVHVVEQGYDNRFPYIVMELLRGRTLAELMADTNFVADLPTKVDLIAQVCLGLHHAHEQRVVHGNVLTDDGTAKILNFISLGAASAVDRTIVSDHPVVGSFEYMSPEQIIGRDALDGRSDVFSVGVVLYELIAGRRPFQGVSTTATLARILRDDPAALDVPPRLNAILKRALGKEPEKRFASAQELAYALWMMGMPEATLEPDAEPEEGASRTMIAEPAYEEEEEEAEAVVAEEEEGILTRCANWIKRALGRE